MCCRADVILLFSRFLLVSSHAHDTGLADDNPIWYPWGRAPGSSPASASAPSSSLKKQKKGPSGQGEGEGAGAEEDEGGVLDIGRLRFCIGAPLPPALCGRLVAWLIAKRECSRLDEAAAQVAVLQRLFRQALAVQEYKLWRAGLRDAADEQEGGPIDVRLPPGSLPDKEALRKAVAEAVS